MKQIDLVILAAGKSSRFGSLKGFAFYEGTPLLESAIQLHQSHFDGKTIVVYSKDSQLYCDKLAPCFPDAIFIENEEPENGPFSSLQKGLKESTAQFSFVLPVDCPCRNHLSWLKLSKKIDNHSLVIKPSFNDKGGHPILIQKKIIHKIIASSPTSKLNLFLRQLSFDVLKYVPLTDPTILENVNTPKDLR